MKISKINIRDNFLLSNQTIDFKKDGKVLDMIAITGKNGCGKTTFLNEIIRIFTNRSNDSNSLEIVDASLDVDKIIKNYDSRFEKNSDVKNIDIEIVNGNFKYKEYEFHIKHNVLQDKLIFVPAELNFNVQAINTMQIQYIKGAMNNSPFVIINNTMTENIQTIISNHYQSLMKVNNDMTIKSAEADALNSINQTFEILNLDIKLVDISFETGKLRFSNGISDDIDIEMLSSGEKQLFVRIMILKALHINNSIILIDEPELSMHPDWLRKVIDIYRNLGANNQIIIATHSPLILGSMYPYEIFVMKQEREVKYKLISSKTISPYTKGATVDCILTDIMELTSSRYYKTEEDLNKLRQMAKEGKGDSKEFTELYGKLQRDLSHLDSDLKSIKKISDDDKPKQNEKGK